MNPSREPLLPEHTYLNEQRTFISWLTTRDHKRIALLESEGAASAAYRRIAFLDRLLGSGVGLVVVTILYFMVAKPAA